MSKRYVASVTIVPIYCLIYDLDIDKYYEEQVNSNTNRETKSDMKILNAFMLQVLKDNRDICQIPDNELNTIICEFIINVHQRNGSEYEPNTVKGIVASYLVSYPFLFF
jgi:hypothetical protein